VAAVWKHFDADVHTQFKHIYVNPPIQLYFYIRS